MRVVKFSQGLRNAEGILDGERIQVVGPWREGPAQEAPFHLARMSPRQVAAAAAGSLETLDRGSVRLEAPIDAFRQIICIGLNYATHVGEAAGDMPKQPALFTRHLRTLVGPEDQLRAPSASGAYDFEGEIALVIGRGGRDIDRASALAHIGGFTCFMDGSVREYQRHSISAGKNFDSSGGVGPWIVTADEIADPAELSLTTRLNGKSVQAAKAKEMLYDIPTLIAYCSTWTELRPGDVIATGTPAGVGAFRQPPVWLQPGDNIAVEISAVGTLSLDVS